MKQKELNKAIAGRGLVISVAPGTNVHELEKGDRDRVSLEIFNSDSCPRYCDITYNGISVRVKVPAGDSKRVGPLALAGRVNDDTEVVNKNLILVAETANTLKVMGDVS